MNRKRLSIATCFAASLAALGAYASPSGSADPPIVGEVVDADIPATYRLPAVHPPTATEDAVPPAIATADPAAEVAHATPYEVALHEPATTSGKENAEVDTVAYTPTTAELTSQLLPAVRRGFGLAQRGALFAARTEFVQVLRRVAQAQDAATNTTEHSQALAAGLRALDEAEDFVPEGVQLEAEVDVRIVASSHRTDVLPATGEVSTFEAVALYHAFAEDQLAKAMAGEQAGSMALHGLGMIHVRLAERSDHDLEQNRSAVTMYSAALDTCPNNHLAANELGVLQCRAGRAEEAAALFEQTIDFAPSAAAYHNLAAAQRRLGFNGAAEANEAESQRLAMFERQRGEVSRRAGVQWVTPAEMARTARTADTPPAATEPQSAPPAAKSPWQRTVDFTKKTLPGSGNEYDSLGPPGSTRVARPNASAASPAPQWR